MASSPTVLVFTCSEYGQANVNLATSYELALAGANVYISSFASLEPRVARLQELVARHASRAGGKPAGSVHFYECKGVVPYWDAINKHGLDSVTLQHPYGISGALGCYQWIPGAVYPWSPEEHLAAIKRIKEMIAAVKPNVVVIDPLFLPAIDACKLVGQKFVVLTPTSINELARQVQPYLAKFWKYPFLASGFSFPLKWWQIPLNIYLQIRLVIQMIFSSHVRNLIGMRRSLGITAASGYMMYPEVTYICPALPETDWPFPTIPQQILPCGPIITPFDPLEEKDPALKEWLDNGPTVMINLGSHVVSDERLAREMASAFRLLLDHHDRKGTSKIQVLWKSKASEDVRRTIDEIVGQEVKEGRIKVVAWLEAEPVSILQHPNVVCTVHHGGANSFFEGVWSGVPHVVLPVWLDTYENANRAEYLDIGLFASKSCAPGVRAEEFGQALVRVTGDGEEARKFRSAAARLKGVCQAKGSGRKLASVAILKEVGVTV